MTDRPAEHRPNLLDPHALLCALDDDNTLGPNGRAALEASREPWLSSATLWVVLAVVASIGCRSEPPVAKRVPTPPTESVPAAPVVAYDQTEHAFASNPSNGWTDGPPPAAPTLQAARTTVTTTHHRYRYEEGPSYTVLDRRLRITRPEAQPVVMLVQGDVGLSPDGAHLIVLSGRCPEAEAVENASPDTEFGGGYGPLLVDLDGSDAAGGCQTLPVGQTDGGSVAWSDDSRRVAWITVTLPDEDAWMVILDRADGSIRTAAVGDADCPCGSPCTGPPLRWLARDRVQVLAHTDSNGTSLPPGRTYDARLESTVPCAPPDAARSRSFARTGIEGGAWLFTWGAGTYVAVGELRDRTCATIATFGGAAIEVAPDHRSLAVYTPVGSPLAEPAALRLYRLPSGTELPPVRLAEGARIASLEWQDDIVVADVVVGEGRSKVTTDR